MLHSGPGYDSAFIQLEEDQCKFGARRFSVCRINNRLKAAAIEAACSIHKIGRHAVTSR
jgi:hypothetical protein